MSNDARKRKRLTQTSNEQQTKSVKLLAEAGNIFSIFEIDWNSSVFFILPELPVLNDDNDREFSVFWLLEFKETSPFWVNEALRQYWIIFTNSVLRFFETNSTRSMISNELFDDDDAEIDDSVKLAVMNDENKSFVIGDVDDLYDMNSRRSFNCFERLWEENN